MRSTLVLAALSLAASCHRNSAAREPSASTAEREAPSAATGSGSDTAAPEPIHEPHVILRPAGHPPVTVRVEVQRTEEQRQRGLMFRRELAPMAGMIFVFPQPSHLTFWMHNTYLPLDMIFITEDRRVLGVVRNATPMTDDLREVPGDSLYVLEVNAGFADRHHITAGTPVELVNVPPALE